MVTVPIDGAFDIFCFCDRADLFFTEPSVEIVETGPQVFVGANDQLIIVSGGALSTGTAHLRISANVPEAFTIEFTVLFGSLPTNFQNVREGHVYIGASNVAGAVAGLFLSRVGLAYSGSVHFDGEGNLVLDGPLQPLAGSDTLVSQDTYLTFRIAVDGRRGVTYVYVTESAQVARIGHQLRYILPSLGAAAMATAPSDELVLSVRGTARVASSLLVKCLCLGTGAIIPNLAPNADAGVDQAARRCSVVRLDGSRSFDPEGAPLSYAWRLLDAPFGSQYNLNDADGRTYPLAPPTGFTDKFYAEALGIAHGTDPLIAGDVLVLAGVAYPIVAWGSDGNGFFVRVLTHVLPDTLAGSTPYGFMRQRGVSEPTSAKPTFYPDVDGLYRFDLTVFDGGLYSAVSVTMVNVTESSIARGVTPDLRFLWGQLSDFWQLVEERERIETVWSGIAQAVAAELLNLWQIDYGKSLRDVQRTLQRRWLHYDLLMRESLPELTTVRALFGGLESVDLALGAALPYGGLHVDFELPTVTAPYVVHFSGVSLTLQDVADTLQAALYRVDGRVTVRVLTDRAGQMQRVRIDAPFRIAALSASTATLFDPLRANAHPSGSGAAMSARSYRVDRSLQFLDIRESDLLLLGDVAYRIARVVDDASDPWRYQRVTLLDAVPIPANLNWSIPSQITSRTLNFWDSLVSRGDHATVEIVQLSDGRMITEPLAVLGACPSVTSMLAVDATSLGPYLQNPAFAVYLASVLRRSYLPIDPLVVDIPYLQEAIKIADPASVLRRNVDYLLTTHRGAPALAFATGDGLDIWQHGLPPDRLWAETTYLDNRPTIESNFGIPAEFTLDDLSNLPENVDYLSSVRGLWFAYFNGPTLFNLKAGTQILLGLPFAEEAGVIEEIRTDFSATSGRILVRDTASTEIVRSYSYPASLGLEMNPLTHAPYAIGDAVAQFTPLVQGVEVVDHVKDPAWYLGFLQQGVFTEVEKYFKFLVRVDSSAFNLAALLFVQSFILRVKPTYTMPIFVVLAKLADAEVSVSDAVAMRGTLHLNDGARFVDYGTSTMFDEPRPAGGGAQSRYDNDSDPATPLAVDPTAQVVTWGFDKTLLSPVDIITVTLSEDFALVALPTYDAVFRFDTPARLFRTGANEDWPWYFDTVVPAGRYTITRTL